MSPAEPVCWNPRGSSQACGLASLGSEAVVMPAVPVGSVWDAVLVVEQDQSDEYGPDHEGEQAQEVPNQREFLLVNLRHALHRREVDVGTATEGEEEAHNAVVHV
mmetsp:Transcript_31966/g.99874  ORF Transcript_31966/g.99874 Transcript_31966/m.99874 type:complete len:105 (+) Transcript_31966:179-493(+)